MIVSNCPRCEEAFQVPAVELPDDAYAQCPWCRETYPIAEVVHRLPPKLQVLTADGQKMRFAATEATSTMVHSGASAVGSAADAGFSPANDPGAGSAETVQYDAEIDVEDLDEFVDEDDDLGNKTVTDETVSNETWTDDSVVLDDTYATVQANEVDFDVRDPDQAWAEEQVLRSEGAMAPMKVSPAPATSRKAKTSPVRTMISVVLGGLAAGPIAVAILWVLTQFGVNVDLGFWPLNGSSSSISTPENTFAAAPVDLTNPPRSDQDKQRALQNKSRSLIGNDTANENTLNAADPADAALKDILGQDDPEESTEPSDIVLPNVADSGDPVAPATVDPAEDESGTSISMPSAADDTAIKIVPIQSADNNDDPGPDEEASVVPASATDELTEPEAEPIKVEPIQATQTTPEAPAADPFEVKLPSDEPPAAPVEAAELVTAREKSLKLLSELGSIDRSDANRKRKLALTYAAIADVAALATNAESLQPLLDQITSSTVVQDLSDAAPQWLAFKKRTSNGVLLTGKAGGTENKGTITLSDETVVSLTDDSPSLPKSETVIGLGRIKESPSGQMVELVAVETLP